METDEQIALQVQQGDAEAFGELMRRYDPKLLRYARKFLLELDDAADIVQEVFLKTYENIQSYDASRPFSPWVYRIAHNEFINEIKKRSSRKTTFTIDFDTLFPTLAAVETADSVALERDARQMVDRFLSQVDPKYREPLILYYLEEMDYRAIADILRIPVSTVGVRLMRGKAQLQRLAQETKTNL